MARAPPRPATLLGMAIQHRRAGSQEEAGTELGLGGVTISRLERGTHRPTYDTAVKLAAWLGWTTDQVMEAAGRPAPGPGEGNST